MPVSMQQLMVALPFSLVSVLGVALVAENYGLESTDLLAVPPADLDQVRRDSQPAPLTGRLRELWVPTARPTRPSIWGFTSPAQAGLAPLGTNSGSAAEPDSSRRPPRE